MSFKINKDLKPILYPYMFVLKEGKTIQRDLFDYSLIMFHVGQPEILSSPKRAKRTLSKPSYKLKTSPVEANSAALIP